LRHCTFIAVRDDKKAPNVVAKLEVTADHTTRAIDETEGSLSRLKRSFRVGKRGADRMAVDFAIWHDIPHADWCPAEDGILPVKYRLTQTPSSLQELAVQRIECLRVVENRVTLPFARQDQGQVPSISNESAVICER
jgi:hypothetical protein